MPEKLVLQWNDFKDNVKTAFGNLRDDNNFTDVTLAPDDGQQDMMIDDPGILLQVDD